MLFCVSTTRCIAQEILLLHESQGSAFEDGQILTTAAFLGLDVRVLNVDQEEDRRRVLSYAKDPATLATMISAKAMDHLDWAKTIAAIQPRSDGPPRIMIYGITSDVSKDKLKLWSDSAIERCIAVDPNFKAPAIDVGELRSITRQLGGRQLPPVSIPTCGFETVRGDAVHTVLSARQSDGTRTSFMVRAASNSVETFLLARTRSPKTDEMQGLTTLANTFSSAAPFIFFLSYAAGEYAWHQDGHYANLTIDDPWLVQPYGYLDYKTLLLDMQSHDFHTTIAFIPWNFDRSRPDVVELLKAHPDRYSICVHGNNHAHREFGEYSRNSLSDQVADVKQGIARMERFTALTHLPYDRFMVFPHAVAPEPTFAALETYGFLGTANSSNVPLGEPNPRDPIFFLRPYTTAYAGLLSFYRYPAAGEIPYLEIAIHAFLGNPILFYDHASFFSSGIGAFDAHADFINQIQPDTRWTSLGEIARHSFLMRSRGDGDTDVLMLSSEMKLENSAGVTKVYHVRRNSGAQLGGVLTADAPLTFSADSSEVRIVVPAHESKLLRMNYANDLNVAHEELKTRNSYVYTLRLISDLRDLYISKSPFGESFVRSYYRYRWDSAELIVERNWWVLILIVLVVYATVRYCRNKALHIPAKGRGTKAI